MLKKIISSPDLSLYSLKFKEFNLIDSYIASTRETRAISNNPFVMGIKYTDYLEKACSKILTGLFENKLISIKEKESIVFNILRGGLNFGLRNALSSAFGWNYHGCSFISAQRARKDDSPEEWHIIESEYTKVYMPETASIIIGDVVATGTSLEHAIKALVNETKKQGANLKSIIFFTFGGKRAAEILNSTDKMCREKFKDYQRTVLIYHEGCFSVPDEKTPLSVKETGTDLVRLNSIMAPEFIESQYTNPLYPLQRCVIYDAGSRAFWIPEYLEDLKNYWTQLKNLAENGLNFHTLLNERFPELDQTRFSQTDLTKICNSHLEEIEKLISDNN
ncbi:MAG: hypothetical protein CSA18_03460 [Deltaproteobacteria bacterium]|nr:MAG: hypothetical protein CSA18_03460 [Deltaproteobacteria bacterium]